MGKIAGWTKVNDKKMINTGGGISFLMTSYRFDGDPQQQVEILQEYDSSPRGSGRVFVYAGFIFEDGLGFDSSRDDADWLVEDYVLINEFSSFAPAKRRALAFMRAHPGGLRRLA